MKATLILVAVLFLSSCASRTRYQKYEKNQGGYVHGSFMGNLSMVTFRANASTDKSIVENFAKIRAVELCLESGKKFADLLGFRDRSETRNYVRSQGDVFGFPSYFHGHSPFALPHGLGMGPGFATMRMNVWSESVVYPVIDVIFRCIDRIFEPEIVVREVSPKEMNHLIQDLKGALQVENVLDRKLNPGILEGDIILKVGSNRIEKNWQLLKLFEESQRSLKFLILRDGAKLWVEIASKEVTEDVRKSQLEIIGSACEFQEIRKRPVCN